MNNTEPRPKSAPFLPSLLIRWHLLYHLVIIYAVWNLQGAGRGALSYPRPGLPTPPRPPSRESQLTSVSRPPGPQGKHICLPTTSLRLNWYPSRPTISLHTRTQLTQSFLPLWDSSFASLHRGCIGPKSEPLSVSDAQGQQAPT